MDLIEIRNLLNVTQEEFCNYYGIPLRTYQNWVSPASPQNIKPYAKDWLEFKVMHDYQEWQNVLHISEYTPDYKNIASILHDLIVNDFSYEEGIDTETPQEMIDQYISAGWLTLNVYGRNENEKEYIHYLDCESVEYLYRVCDAKKIPTEEINAICNSPFE